MLGQFLSGTGDMGIVGGTCVYWQTCGGYGKALGLLDTLDGPE